MDEMTASTVDSLVSLSEKKNLVRTLACYVNLLITIPLPHVPVRPLLKWSGSCKAYLLGSLLCRIHC